MHSSTPAGVDTQLGPVRPISGSPAVSYPTRKRVVHDGRVVYEWEQELDDVSLYLNPPPSLPSSLLSIVLLPDRLTVGIKGNPPYLDEVLGGPIVPSSSYWTYSDGEVHVLMHKAVPGSAWTQCTAGGAATAALSEAEALGERQRMLRERFQREHPHFDFSSADISGEVPDAAHFMGGIDRSALYR